jgi:Fe-S-cluster-containing dehydrogenase component
MSEQIFHNRRDFLKRLVAGGTAAAVTLVTIKHSAIATVIATDDAHAYAFVVDVQKCIGCGNCVRACALENHVPDGNYRTWVERYVSTGEQVYIDSPKGAIESFPKLDAEIQKKAKWSAFVPKLCNHCKHAPCVQVCPVGATFHAPGGFVLVDPEHCIGCGYCIQACPYGARFFNRDTQMADKCTWCYHRVMNDLLPACATVCPTKARSFGNLKDPDSHVAKVFEADQWQVLKPGMHTESLCFYLGLPRVVV